MSGGSKGEETTAMRRQRIGPDAALDAIGHRHRRELLELLANVEDAVDLTEAAQVLAASDTLSVEDLRFDLHHLHLPKLRRFDLIEYDEVDETIHYRPDSRVEALLETIDKVW